MKRRSFLKSSAALGIPALLSSGVAANPLALFSQFINPDDDRILVLIRLSGGNDGLNTVIGLDQLSKLHNVRPNIALPNSNILGLTDTVGIHGSMGGMQNLFNESNLSIIQAVGYPNANRSHFRSTDIWTSASSANEAITTGWLGRYLDQDHPDYPNNYPNNQHPHPLAMTMGTVVSETCQGQATNLSITVNNPLNYLYIAPGGNTPLPNNRYGREVSFIRSLIGQSNTYGDIVQTSAQNGNSLSQNYTSGRLSTQLRNIATLISGGLNTRIYVATLGSFDTHANQVSGGNTSTGRHADLLTELSQSIAAFMEDLRLMGISNRVLGMTFSEFGRRIRSNESNGTDHGDAAPLFLFGDCVTGNIIGENPEIDTQVNQSTGVPMQFDFRDVYGSVLVDWFDVPENTVRNLIHQEFMYLPVANNCTTSLPIDPLTFVVTPSEHEIQISWQTFGDKLGGRYVLERASDGRNFKELISKVAPPTTDTERASFSHNDRDVVLNKTYYYRIRSESASGEKVFSQIKLGRLQGSSIGSWSVGLPTPNPARYNSYVQVFSPVSEYATHSLMDNQGRVLNQEKTWLSAGINERLPILANGLPAGIYYWRLLSDSGKQFSRKVIVQ